jgi:hypothetical protein
MVDLAKLQCADFQACVGQEFTIATTGGSFSLELVDAAETSPPISPQFRTPFALTFRGPAQVHLRQAIYRLENTQLGAMEIFIVQVRADATGSFFEAIFN